MRAITILQPYASLIMSGAKRVENRTWTTKYRGRLYIHAGKSREALRTKEVDGREFCIDTGREVERLPFGAVIGIAVLVDIVPFAEIDHPDNVKRYPWLKTHEHATGPFCWVFAEKPTHIGPWPFRGAQSLWDINPLTLDQVANRCLGFDAEKASEYRMGCE